MRRILSQSVVTYASAFDDEVVTSDTEEGFVLEEPFFSDSVKASPIEKEVKNEVVEAPLEVELPPFEAEELKGAEAPVRAVAAEAYYFYQGKNDARAMSFGLVVAVLSHGWSAHLLAPCERPLPGEGVRGLGALSAPHHGQRGCPGASDYG